MNQIAYVLLVLLMFCIVGCGGNSPEGVAKTYVGFLEDADFKGMRQMSTGGMIRWIDRAERRYDEIAKMFGEKKAAKIKKTYDNLKYEIGESSVGSGDAKTTVPVKINGQNTPMTLIKINDEWRIEKFNFPII